MHLASTGTVDFSAIDQAMEAAGFKMGPFKLMDLIGMDINYAVSESIYQAFEGVERFKPSPMQQQKVAEGKLGRKTGEGFYSWTAETMTAERERYQSALREGLKIIQKDLPEIK
jgi:3-hydroxybutyryl-CoA dehydrogenase